MTSSRGSHWPPRSVAVKAFTMAMATASIAVLWKVPAAAVVLMIGSSIALVGAAMMSAMVKSPKSSA